MDQASRRSISPAYMYEDDFGRPSGLIDHILVLELTRPKKSQWHFFRLFFAKSGYGIFQLFSKFVQKSAQGGNFT